MRKPGVPLHQAPRLASTIGRGLAGLHAPIDHCRPAQLNRPSWRAHPIARWSTILIGGATAVTLIRWLMLLPLER
ncbi:MAG: hypothetical protein FJ293_15810 [Planctomycetes bacterium]|nr:hypothetical protein [Planctomycetota bacterium]